MTNTINNVNSKNSMADYYNSIANGYDELHSEEQLKKLELIGKEIQTNKLLQDFIKPSYKLLDVGCGTGISTGFFNVKEKYGIDPSSELVKIAIKNNPHAKFLVGSAEQLPYKKGEFDLVLSLTAIQNFTDILKGLLEIKRVGKRFILTFLKKSSKNKEIDELIRLNFKVLVKLEEDKDWIYFCE